MAFTNLVYRSGSKDTDDGFVTNGAGTVNSCLTDGSDSTYLTKSYNQYGSTKLSLLMVDPSPAEPQSGRFIYYARPHLRAAGNSSTSIGLAVGTTSSKSSYTNTSGTLSLPGSIVSVSSASRAAGGVVTVTTGSAHGLATGNRVVISGNTNGTTPEGSSGFINGSWVVTVTSSTVFTFTHNNTTASSVNATNGTVVGVNVSGAQHWTDIDGTPWTQSDITNFVAWIQDSSPPPNSYGTSKIYEIFYEVVTATNPSVSIASIDGDASAPYVVTTTTKPVIAWTYSQAESLGQTAWSVKVFTSDPGAGGAETASAYWSSSGTGSTASATMTTDLVNGTTYYVYVKVGTSGTSGTTAANWSSWVGSSFSVSLTAPVTPTIESLSWDGATQRTEILVGVNMLPNPSFDTDATGWSNVSNATSLTRVTSATVAPQAGTGSLSFASIAAGDMSIRTANGTSAVPVTAGQTYTASGYFRSATAARSVGINISWLDATGASLSSDTVGTTSTSSTSAWTRVSTSGTAPNGAYYAFPYFRVVGTAAAGEVHYLDSAQFEPGGLSTFSQSGIFSLGSQTWDVQRSDDAGVTWSYVRGAQSGNSTASGATPAAWQVYDYEPPRGRANVIANSSVEAATTNYASANLTLARSTDYSISGSYSIKGTVSGASAPTLSYNSASTAANVPATAGSPYVFSTWLLAGPGNVNDSTTVTPQILWRDSGGVQIGGATSGAVVTLVRGQWVRLTSTGTAPANTVAATVRLLWGAAQPIGSTFYSDAWQFEPGSTASEFAPPPQYRVRSVATVSGASVSSAWSASTIGPTDNPSSWWLIPLNGSGIAGVPLSGVKVLADLTFEQAEPVGIFRPQGRSRTIVVHGTITGRDGDYQILTLGIDARDQLLAIVNSQRTVLVVDPFGEAKYVRFTGRSIREDGDASNPRFIVTASYVEVDSGLVAG